MNDTIVEEENIEIRVPKDVYDLCEGCKKIKETDDECIVCSGDCIIDFILSS